MKNLALASAVGLGCASGAVEAATYTFDVGIDLSEDGRVYSTSTSEWWEEWFNVAPTVVTSGDRLVFNIGFINNQALKLSDLDGDNIELSKLTLGLSGSTFSQDAVASSHEYTDYYGDLVTPTFSAITTSVDGDFVPLFHQSNLTDTSFTYSSITFSVDLDIRDPVGSDTALLTRIEWTSLAQRVEIVDTPPGCIPSGGRPPKCDDLSAVPLPASLPLLAAGIAGLGFWRRRQNKKA